MGQQFWSLFQLERKRLLWLIGITFAVVLAFQYFELPYVNKIPTLNTGRLQAADSPSESQTHYNIIGMNLTREVNITSVSDHKLNGSYSDFYSPNSHAIPPTYLTPPINPPTKTSPSIAPSKLSNDSEKTDFMEDERFRLRPLQDDVNVVSKSSPVTNVPKEIKDSSVTVSETTSISEMDKLLLQNHASYHSMVFD